MTQILVIEDDDLVRNMISNTLRKAGFEVALAANGKEGLEQAEALKPELVVTDIDQESIDRAVKQFDATAVAPDAIYDVEADVYAPCALGATINDMTLPRLKVGVVAGSANNVLAESRHGDELHERGILYAPDYVINAGGLMSVYGELQGWDRDRVIRQVAEIHRSLKRLFAISKAEGVAPHVAADMMARERIAAVGALHRVRTHSST